MNPQTISFDIADLERVIESAKKHGVKFLRIESVLPDITRIHECEHYYSPSVYSHTFSIISDTFYVHEKRFWKAELKK